MIGALSGTVAHQRDDVLIVDVRGVGYEVTVSATVLERLHRESEGRASEVRLVVFTDVRESAISLFGFADQLEREVFMLLRRVKGIGSRLALNVLSSVGASGVLRAIAEHDIGRLKQVSGIGAKTAERVVLELREQVREYMPAVDAKRLPPMEISRSGREPTPIPGPEGDVVLALERLGFPAERAREAVSSVMRGLGVQPGKAELDSGELLRLTLGTLA